MSFDCEHCGYQNNEIQNSGKISDKGIKIMLQIKTTRDLNRQVVKSDYTSVQIPSLDFEIPSRSQKGEITTVEGIIERAIDGLEQDQPTRRKEHPSAAAQIDEFVKKLKELKSLAEPFTIIFEDISGDCHVENPNAPLKDEGYTATRFKRTTEQNHILGIYAENSEDVLLKPIKEGEYTLEQIEGEVLSFRTNCPECNCPCETNMKMTSILFIHNIKLYTALFRISSNYLYLVLFILNLLHRYSTFQGSSNYGNCLRILWPQN